MAYPGPFTVREPDLPGPYSSCDWFAAVCSGLGHSLCKWMVPVSYSETGLKLMFCELVRDWAGFLRERDILAYLVLDIFSCALNDPSQQ